MYVLLRKIYLVFDIIGEVNLVIFVLVYLALVATAVAFPKWREHEHNRVFTHFITVQLLFCIVTVFENHIIKMFWFLFKSLFVYHKSLIFVINYVGLCVSVWKLLFILCLRKMFVEVIVTSDIYKWWIYVLGYLMSAPIPFALACNIFSDYIRYVYVFILLCLALVSTVLYVMTVVSVVRSIRSGVARHRNTAQLVRRFILLYTIVSGNHFVWLAKISYEYVLAFNFTPSLYAQATIEMSLFITYILTPVSVLYCLFGNPQTRDLWRCYIRRKFGRASASPQQVNIEMT